MNRLPTSLVLLKPDAVERRLVGQLLTYFESNMMFKVVGVKMLTMDAKFCREHYADHVGKDFYENLEKFMISGPLVALAIEGDVAEVRKTGMVMRDLFNKDYKGGPRNLVHASDSAESAAREVGIWFPTLGWTRCDIPPERQVYPTKVCDGR